MKITPSAFLDELYPPRTAFAPCSRWKEVRLVHEFQWQTNALSGALNTCVGPMPALGHRDAASDIALDYMRIAGLEPPSRLQTYRTDREAADIASGFAASGLRLATTLPHTPEIKALNASLVPSQVFDYLNDKRNLASLCNAQFVPARRIYDRASLHELEGDAISFPVFLKGAVEGASGGGLDVRLCKDRNDLKDAIAWFKTVPAFNALIVEAAIPFASSWCLNYAILDDKIIYLGAAEQLFGSPGLQSGSIIDPDNPVPGLAVEVGREICEAGSKLGYRGIVGFDMCADADGRVYFFDLNFRPAGCTCLILIHGGMEDARHSYVFSGGNFPGKLKDVLPHLRPLIENRRFMPVGVYDGGEIEGLPPFCRITGIARSGTREDALALSNEVKALLSAPLLSA